MSFSVLDTRRGTEVVLVLLVVVLLLVLAVLLVVVENVARRGNSG